MKKKEEQKIIKELIVNKEMTYKEIIKITGFHNTKIRNICKELGIKRKLYRAHPNLKKDYFKKINTKNKAYWLGFLCADGYVAKNRNELKLNLALKDSSIIEKFCDEISANKNKIKIRTHSNGYQSILVSIVSKEFVEFLIKQGCGNKKTYNMKLPHLKEKELELAFLSGYYDGDGTANSTTLTCALESFLIEIKNKYNLNYKIRKYSERCYAMSLGSDLRRKMIKNYPNCMERKKKLFYGDKQYKTNNINKRDRLEKRKFHITKEYLEKLINDNSYEKIGRMFNVSGNAIKKRAKRLSIELKPKIKRCISPHADNV